MRALCWYGRGDVRVENVPGPELLNPQDAIIKASFVITHKLNLDDAPDTYRRFRDKEDGCIKVVMKP